MEGPEGVYGGSVETYGVDGRVIDKLDKLRDDFGLFLFDEEALGVEAPEHVVIG